MPDSLDRIDRVINKARDRIVEQAIRVATSKARGVNTAVAEQSLRSLELDLDVYVRTRETVAGACRVLDESRKLYDLASAI